MNNKKPLIIIILSLLLIVVGIVLILTGNNSSLFGHKKTNSDSNENVEDDIITPPVDVAFNKNNVMTIIYDSKSKSNSSEEWYVGDTALLAHNSDDSKYLVRYKAVLPNGKVKEYESIVTKEELGYSIEFPGWEVDSKNLDEYGFIYYVEGAEGYDPANQQYGQAEVGWYQDPSQWEYVPDNSWQQNQTW